MMIPKKNVFTSVLVLILFMGTNVRAEEELYTEAEGNSSTAVDDYNNAPSDDDVAQNKVDNKSGGGKLKLERPLLLTRHTMQLGGEISLNPQIYIRKGDVPNTDKTEGGGVFTFSPSFGYFVIDKLEILFGFGLALPFGYIGDNSVALGFDVGARYFIDFDVVALYMGGVFGPGWVIPDAPNAPIADYFNINIMVGILFPLNRHIGIDLGMRMNTSIRIDNDFPDGAMRTTISFPIGYLGVSGFFNIITGG